jgi:hypothetical protein
LDVRVKAISPMLILVLVMLMAVVAVEQRFFSRHPLPPFGIYSWQLAAEGEHTRVCFLPLVWTMKMVRVAAPE